MITQAAIHYKRKIYTLPRPARHHDLIRLIANLTGASPASPIVGEEQGFIDDQGRFLRRKPAALHAIKCGQIKDPSTLRGGYLYSEDLW